MNKQFFLGLVVGILISAIFVIAYLLIRDSSPLSDDAVRVLLNRIETYYEDSYHDIDNIEIVNAVKQQLTDGQIANKMTELWCVEVKMLLYNAEEDLWLDSGPASNYWAVANINGEWQSCSLTFSYVSLGECKDPALKPFIGRVNLLMWETAGCR